MANYMVDPRILDQYLPYDTQFDRWQDQCYVSLVGFMFRDTRFAGIQFPFHIDFEEVNLRFYVRHVHQDVWKRGVVFIKEIVPLPLVTLVANTLFREHYETMPMKHTWISSPDQLSVEYQWKKKEWYAIKINCHATPQVMTEGSEVMFFTDQHWGYTRVNPQLTLEYEVAHPLWTYYKTIDYRIDVDFGNIYGDSFAFLTNQKPHSVFLAEGSEITLRKNIRIKTK